jgi:hypothetical protein
MDKDMLTNAAALGEIIRLHNEAVERLKAYRVSRPYLMAPNLGSMLEGNLKDNIEVLYRELNNLAKPRSAKKQYVCTQCHGVFLQRLPGGICDQCKSRVSLGSGRYGANSQPTASAGSGFGSGGVFDSRAATALSSAADSDAEQPEDKTGEAMDLENQIDDTI